MCPHKVHNDCDGQPVLTNGNTFAWFVFYSNWSEDILEHMYCPLIDASPPDILPTPTSLPSLSPSKIPPIITGKRSKSCNGKGKRKKGSKGTANSDSCSYNEYECNGGKAPKLAKAARHARRHQTKKSPKIGKGKGTTIGPTTSSPGFSGETSRTCAECYELMEEDVSTPQKGLGRKKFPI